MEPFENHTISTMTIVCTLNCKLDVERIFRMLPITQYEPPKKTRGRKKKDQVPEPEPRLKPGSIISVKFREEHRGAVLKKVKIRSDGSRKFFRNQTTVDLVLEEKRINIKIFSGEKTGAAVFHVTGCKNQEQCEQGISYLWSYIRQMGRGLTEKELRASFEEMEDLFLDEDGNDIYDDLPVTYPHDDGEGPVYRDFIRNQPLRILLDTVMINTDYHLGFNINRGILNLLMSRFKGFISDYEPSGDTGVNIRYYYEHPEEYQLDMMKWNDEDEDFDIYEIDRNEFYRSLPKRKEIKKKPHHTILVFREGKVIQSGRYYSEMKEIYEIFMKIIQANREQIEDKGDAEPEKRMVVRRRIVRKTKEPPINNPDNPNKTTKTVPGGESMSCGCGPMSMCSTHAELYM